MKNANSSIRSLNYLINLGIVCGLVLVVLLFTSHQLLENEINLNEDSAATINISGRQRMLLQRTAMLSLSLSGSQNNIEKIDIREKLIEALKLMEQSHNELATNSSNSILPGSMSPKISSILFESPFMLDRKMRSYIRVVKSFIESSDNRLVSDNINLKYLSGSNNDELLAALDAAVKQYQEDAEERLFRLQELEDGALTISIFLLLIMALFVFLPVVRRLKKETRSLQENEERYRSFVHNFNGIAFQENLDFVPLFVHGAVERITGYTEGDFIAGSPRWDQIIHTDDLPKTYEEADKLRSIPDYMSEREYRIFHKNGEQRWVCECIQNACDKSGKPAYVRGTLHDITVQKRTEKNLEKAISEAEKANKEKSAFVANLSHDIRTPLTGIMGMTNLLEETSLTEEQCEHVKMLTGACNNLLDLINNTLDLSKIEAGKLELEEIEFNPHDIVRTIVDTLAVCTRAKGIKLTYNISPDVPVFLKGDPIRLRQILINLVGNAVKFTQVGGVAIEVEKQRGETKTGDENKIELLFSIKDTGIGIPSEKINSIFKSYIQLDSSTTRIYGGTGLGTTISKELIEMMGGNIRVVSEVGKGSTFYFTVEFGRQEKKLMKKIGTEKTAIAEITRPLDILLVEDSEDNQQLIKLYLKKSPYKIDIANNGEIGVQKFISNNYDIVLMDMQMPVMDGYMATREIKKWLSKNDKEDVPIIAFTAHAFKNEVAECIDAGCAAHLSKPAKKEQVLEAIYKYANNTK